MHKDKCALLANQYRELRENDSVGWTNEESYSLKQTRILDALSEHSFPQNAAFLELGCGAGNIAIWMAARGYHSFGIDVIPEAIDWATAKASEGGIAASFVLGALSNMTQFCDAQFDIIFDGDCLHMITDSERTASMKELYRILKPSGLLIAGGNVRDEAFTEFVTFSNGAGRFDPNTKLITAGDGVEYLLLSKEELCKELINAGFKVLGIKQYAKRGNQAFVKECISIHATR